MSTTGEIPLTRQSPRPYSCASLSGSREGLGSSVRAMSLYYSSFAFTYRFFYTGKRAGETRAASDTI
jgi:hypothetical protein